MHLQHYEGGKHHIMKCTETQWYILFGVKIIHIYYICSKTNIEELLFNRPHSYLKKFWRGRELHEAFCRTLRLGFLHWSNHLLQMSKLPVWKGVSLSAGWFPAYVPVLLSFRRIRMLMRVCVFDYLLSLLCLVNQLCSALLVGPFWETLIVFCHCRSSFKWVPYLYFVQLFYTLL